jgi:hypothetical protein
LNIWVKHYKTRSTMARGDLPESPCCQSRKAVRLNHWSKGREWQLQI